MSFLPAKKNNCREHGVPGSKQTERRGLPVTTVTNTLQLRDCGSLKKEGEVGVCMGEGSDVEEGRRDDDEDEDDPNRVSCRIT